MKNELFIDSYDTIQQGNCLDVMKAIPEDSIDAIITDPPFAFAGGISNGTSSQVSSQFFDFWWREVCIELQRILKPEGEGFIWCDWKTAASIAEGCAKIIDLWFDIRSPRDTWTRNQIRKMEKVSIDKRTIQYQVRLCILYHILAYHPCCIHKENILTQYCSNCEIRVFIRENEELDNLLTRKAEIEAEYKVICESLRNKGVDA